MNVSFVAIERVTLHVRIKEVPNSIVGSESVCPNRFIRGFSQSLKNFRNTILKYLTTISFYSSKHSRLYKKFREYKVESCLRFIILTVFCRQF
jgi:hypothetical protein